MQTTSTYLNSLAIEQPNQPEVVQLIEALDAYQADLYPPESNHGVDVDALCAPNVVFVVARDARGAAIGCGAVVFNDGYGELKRMYVLPEHRGAGVAKRLLALLEAEALQRRCTTLMLETGISQPEALGFYQRAGFSFRAPFGAYNADPLSVFMSKTL